MQKTDREWPLAFLSSQPSTSCFSSRTNPAPAVWCRYHITKNLTLETNEYGWDKYTNMIFVDQVSIPGMLCKRGCP